MILAALVAAVTLLAPDSTHSIVRFTVPCRSAPPGDSLPALVKVMRVYRLDVAANVWKSWFYAKPRVAGVMDCTYRQFAIPCRRGESTGVLVFVADSAGNAPPNAVRYWRKP